MFALVTDDLLLGASSHVEMSKLSLFVNTIKLWKQQQKMCIVNAAPFEETICEEWDQQTLFWTDCRELVEFVRK